MIGRREVGFNGEEEASAYLRGQGYQVLARNVRRGRGEIDIVARDKGVICFVEVRARRGENKHGESLGSVDIFKQRQLSKLAVLFLKEQHWWGQPARFDVVSVSWGDGGPSVVLIKDAFPVSERFR